MLTMPPPIWTPPRRRPMVRPSIPSHWRRGPHHRPHCPLYMVDGDTSLNTSGDTILNASGDEYLKCCCSCLPCADIAPASIVVVFSGITSCGCGSDINVTADVLTGAANGAFTIPYLSSGCRWLSTVSVAMVQYCGSFQSTRADIIVDASPGLTEVTYTAYTLSGSTQTNLTRLFRGRVSTYSCASSTVIADQDACGTGFHKAGIGGTATVIWR